MLDILHEIYDMKIMRRMEWNFLFKIPQTQRVSKVTRDDLLRA